MIGLNLCPFARKVYENGRIRFAVSDAADAESLLADLGTELTTLTAAPREQIETTLLIHPRGLTDFHDYNDFLSVADELLHDLGLNGVIQIASFHPKYQFSGTKPDDVENETNRSPFPMLHLLREVSVTEVADNEAFLDGIPARNIALLRQLGHEGLRRRLADS